MLDLLQDAKTEAWADVLRTHAELIEKRTEEAADAHAAALTFWWEVSDLFHREALTRLELFQAQTSSTGVPR